MYKINSLNTSKYDNKYYALLSMRFYNGSAFLNHSFIIIGFIDSWRNMFEEADKELFFDNFEQKLNAYANRQGELKLTVPMLYIEARKENGFGV